MSSEHALFSMKQAAEYLGVSRSYFIDHIRPYIAVVDMRSPTSKQPMPRFAKSDLDAFWTARRKARKAS